MTPESSRGRGECRHAVATVADELLIERALVVRHRSGPSLEVLLARHRCSVVRRCTSWLGNRADAEDVAQEVLMRVCSGLHGLEERGRFRAWLARIVDNQCKTFLMRRRWVTVEHIDRLIDLEAGDTERPEDLDAAREQVRRVLERLPADASHVLYLRFFHDLSLDQIANRLDISLSAAKMRLYRGLERFRIHFEALDA